MARAPLVPVLLLLCTCASAELEHAAAPNQHRRSTIDHCAAEDLPAVIGILAAIVSTAGRITKDVLPADTSAASYSIRPDYSIPALVDVALHTLAP